MPCEECNVDPGRFEGECAETAILEYYSLNGCADDMVGGDDADEIKDIFVGPIESTKDALAYAREVGYCDICVEVAMNDLANCKNATFWIDNNGFRFSEMH